MILIIYTKVNIQYNQLNLATGVNTVQAINGTAIVHEASHEDSHEDSQEASHEASYASHYASHSTCSTQCST